MARPHSFVLILVLLFSISLLWSSGILKNSFTSAASASVSDKTKNAVFKKIQLKAVNAKKYIQQKGFNETICFLIDMSLASGQPRFFVYNLKKDTLQNSGLVTHWSLQSILAGRKKIW